MRKDVAKLMNATGSYVIFSAMSGTPVKCLDVTRASQQGGAKIILYENTGKDNQVFHLCRVKGDYYAIVADHSLMVLDVEKASTGNGTPIVQWPYHGGDNQLWKKKDLKDGTCLLCSKLNEDMVLDIQGKKRDNGTPLILFNYTGGDNQKFRLSAV